MSGYEDGAFLKDWEATQRVRHLQLLEELKHEYRSSRRNAVPIEVAVDLPYAVKIPRAVSRHQVKPQSQSPQLPKEQRS